MTLNQNKQTITAESSTSTMLCYVP